MNLTIKIIFFSLLIMFCTKKSFSQTIKYLSIENAKNDSIQINLVVEHISSFEFGDFKYNISNNIIDLQVCYFPSISPTLTEINTFHNIPIEMNKQYQLKVRTYNSTTNPDCNYLNLVDSVSLNFETPITDTVVLSTIEPKSDIVIYPNPTDGKIRIESTYKIEKISIFDTVGREIAMFKATDKVDLSSFENGVYYVKIFVSGNKTFNRKVIKTN